MITYLIEFLFLIQHLLEQAIKANGRKLLSIQFDRYTYKAVGDNGRFFPRAIGIAVKFKIPPYYTS